MLGRIWDDSLGGPQPDSGLSKLRNCSTLNTTHGSGEGSPGNSMNGKPSKFYLQRSLSMETSASPPSSPTAASSLSPTSSNPRDRENVWRSVFHPGSNINAKSIGSDKFDKAEPNSPTVYDWFYSGETKSK